MEKSVFNLIKQNITRNPGRTIKELKEIYRGRATQKDIRDTFYYVKGQKAAGEKVNFSEFSGIVSQIRTSERKQRIKRDFIKNNRVYKWDVRWDLWFIDLESGIEEYQTEVRSTVRTTKKNIDNAIKDQAKKIMERMKKKKSINSWEKLELALREYKIIK